MLIHLHNLWSPVCVAYMLMVGPSTGLWQSHFRVTLLKRTVFLTQMLSNINNSSVRGEPLWSPSGSMLGCWLAYQPHRCCERRRTVVVWWAENIVFFSSILWPLVLVVFLLSVSRRFLILGWRASYICPICTPLTFISLPLNKLWGSVSVLNTAHCTKKLLW